MIDGWLLRQVGGDWRRHRRAWLAVAACFAMVVGLVAARRVVARRLALPPVAAPARVEVIAYLRDDLSSSSAETTALVAVLAAAPGVEAVRRVDADQALGRMRTALGPHARLLDGADDGLLPVSLEVTIAPAGDPVARAHQIGDRLRGLAGVSDVDELAPRTDPTSTFPRLSAQAARLRRTIDVGSWVAIGAALLGVVALRPARRRHEARVMLALGSTRTAAFLPAIVADLLAAVLGAGVALATATLASKASSGARLGAAGWLAADALAVPLFSAREAALLLGLALAAAALAGYLRVRVADPADA